jgi:hypothetical protein
VDWLPTDEFLETILGHAAFPFVENKNMANDNTSKHSSWWME